MSLSDDHKAALAKGRSEARTVRAYLDALTTKKPRGAASAATLQERIGPADRPDRGGTKLTEAATTHPTAL